MSLQAFKTSVQKMSRSQPGWKHEVWWDAVRMSLLRSSSPGGRGFGPWVDPELCILWWNRIKYKRRSIHHCLCHHVLNTQALMQRECWHVFSSPSSPSLCTNTSKQMLLIPVPNSGSLTLTLWGQHDVSRVLIDYRKEGQLRFVNPTPLTSAGNRAQLHN